MVRGSVDTEKFDPSGETKEARITSQFQALLSADQWPEAAEYFGINPEDIGVMSRDFDTDEDGNVYKVIFARPKLSG